MKVQDQSQARASKNDIEDALLSLATRENWIEGSRLKVEYMRPGKHRRVEWGIRHEGQMFTLVWNVNLKQKDMFWKTWRMVMKELQQEMRGEPSMLIGILNGSPPRDAGI